MARVASCMLLIMLALAALPADAAPQIPQSVVQQVIAPGASNPDLMGMVIRDPWYDFGTNPAFPGQANQAFQDTMGTNLQNMGVRWVRLDFHIPFTHTGALEANVINEIAKNDYFINEVAPRNNLKVLALLDFSLVQADPRELNCTSASCLVAGSTFGGGVNKYMDAWLTRALLIADRYRDKIAAYEVLNEENRLASDSSAIAPSIMGRLLTKFYRFCKNIDPTNLDHGCGPTSKIILGGIHPRGTGTAATPNPTDVGYLQAIYADSSFTDFKTAHGSFPVDGIAYHPYPAEIRLSLQDIRVNTGMDRMRAVLNTVDPNQQFWITEEGYNTGFDPDGPKNPIPVQTDAGQAALMRDVYTSLSQRLLPNGQLEVATIFWFKYEDFPPATGANAQRWGVVRIPFTTGNCPGGACYDVNGTPALFRSSFLAYRELAGLTLERTYLPFARR